MWLPPSQSEAQGSPLRLIASPDAAPSFSDSLTMQSLRVKTTFANLALLVGLAFASGAAACSDDPTAPDGASQVAGASYTLVTVDGAGLPHRFPGCDETGVVNAVIRSGRARFGTNGRVQVVHECLGESNVARTFIVDSPFRQSGDTVLIDTFGDDLPPDTAVVRGNSLTVHARFFLAPGKPLARHIMVYTRQEN